MVDSEPYLMARFFSVCTATLWVLLGVWVVPKSLYDYYQNTHREPGIKMHFVPNGQPLPPIPWIQTIWGPGTPAAELLRVGVMCCAGMSILCTLKGI